MADVATMHANVRALLQPTDSQRSTLLRNYRAMLPVMVTRLARATQPIAGDRAAWDATLDSLGADARVLPDLDATALDSALRAHARRVERVEAMHDRAMRALRAAGDADDSAADDGVTKR